MGARNAKTAAQRKAKYRQLKFNGKVNRENAIYDKANGIANVRRHYSPTLYEAGSKVARGDYEAYIKSDAWAGVRRSFKALWPLCRCVVCDSPKFQLHHTTYERFGRELLGDLLPLCEKHHARIHETHRIKRVPLADYETALAVAFNWTDEWTRGRLAEYRSKIK